MFRPTIKLVSFRTIQGQLFQVSHQIVLYINELNCLFVLADELGCM